MLVVDVTGAPAGTPTFVPAVGATMGALVALLTGVVVVVVGFALVPVLTGVAAGSVDAWVDCTRVIGARWEFRALSTVTVPRDFSMACAGNWLTVPASCPNEAEARIRMAAHPPMYCLVEVDMMNFAKGWLRLRFPLKAGTRPALERCPKTFPGPEKQPGCSASRSR